MNFKKYHVSKNLWDNGDTWENVNTDTRAFFQPDIALYDGNTKVGDNARIDVKSNGYKYLVSITPNTSFTRVSIKHNGSTRDLPLGSVYGEFEANVPVTLSFIVNGFDPTTIGGISISNIMLNTGSTPLPYEPYSSEVWHDIPHYIHKTSTDTITTLPADIYPNATTATVGLKGNMQQTGTPTPTTPIQPSECGERTGNLFDSSTIDVGGLSPTTGAETTDNTRRRSGFISVEPNTNYGLSREITSSGSFFWVIAYDENKNIVTDATVSAQYSGVLVTGTMLTINQWTFTTTPTTKYIRLYVTVNNSYKNIMLNTGSTALPYEPYGYKLDISSASTTTPVYLGKVESTRRIKKLVLDGTENFSYDATYTRFTLPIPNARFTANRSDETPCTHYVSIHDGRSIDNVPDDSIYVTAGGGYVYINIKDTTYTSLADFKSYLAAQYAAGTPVTVWYILSEPETAVVNEPLMKIGEYADEVSGISIPVTAGANTLSVDTTVQPSEVTVDYKGWHPVQNVHERDNGAWT